jgi:PKD repeat protein
MIMGGVVMLIVTSQPQPEKVPMAYLGIAKSSDGVDLVNKAGDTLTNSSLTIMVDGIDRTPEFEAQENVPGWGTLKPGDRLHFTSPVKPEVVQIIYSGSAGQYLLASTQPVTNTPVQGGNPIKISAQSVAAGSPSAPTAPTAQFNASPAQGKFPLTVQFTDQSSSTGPTLYKWDINNDGITDYKTKNVTHTYPVAGNFSVKLIVSDAYGSDNEIKTNYIMVTSSSIKPAQTPTPVPTLTPSPTPTPSAAGAPKAQFTSGATQGNSPLTVQFTDQSTGAAPMTYHWDFSDGDGDLPENSQQNPVWRFWGNAGTSFTTTLTVTNAYGSDTITKQNYITLGTPTATAPVAAFTSSAQRGIAPMTVQFTDQSAGTPVSYAWDVNNDGTTDYTTKSPSHTYTAPGTYTVKLIVTNAGGSDSEIKTGYITVSAAGIIPIPTPTLTPVPTITPSPTPTPPQTGAPKAQFTSGATQGNSPLTVQFTDQSTGAAPMTYHWDFSDGDGDLPENSQQNPVWRFWGNAGTSFTTTLTVTNAYGSDTITKQNYITLGTPTATAPVAAFTSSAQRGIAPMTVQFTDQSAGTPVSYAWDVNNDGTTDYTTKSPSHTYTAPGNYSAKLTVTNAQGSDSEIKNNYIRVSTPVSTGALPIARFTASTTSGKAPLTVQFTDQSVMTGTGSYTWDINSDGIVDYTTKNPSHTYTAPGTYTVKLTVTNASGSDSEIKTGYIVLTSLQTGDCYGAETCNPTGNPIGGGTGYSRIITESDPRVKYVVSTKDQLITALKNAKSGEVVFVKGSAVIDMTGTPNNIIPAGVIVASDRGNGGSQGALIKYTSNNRYAGASLFVVGGNNVRVTGLRLEGEMLPQDGRGNGEAYYLRAISAKNKAGLEVDNCEIRGWAWSCVTVMDCTGTNIHHNYMHHNQARGEGYGADIYGGDMLVEANIFNYNRHDIAGGGYPGESYEARYNLVRGDGHPIGSHHFDVHACNPGNYADDSETSSRFIAGNVYRIHHNTFEAGQQAPIGIRSRPVTGAYIYNNVFMSASTDTSGGVPVWQRAVTWGNMFVTNNYWKGRLYAGDDIVWYLHP